MSMFIFNNFTSKLKLTQCFPLKKNTRHQEVYFHEEMVARVEYYYFLIKMKNGQTLLFDFVWKYDRSNIKIGSKRQPFHEMYPRLFK